jgi:hypothetical protein
MKAIKKAKNGTTTKKTTVKPNSEYITQEGKNYTTTKKVNTNDGPRYYQGKSPSMSFSKEIASNKASEINDSIPKAKLSARALEVMNQKNGGSIGKAKDGKWMQKAAASIKKRGTAGKCTPITKPGCTGKAKALAKTFKKIAAKRKSK